MQRRTSHALTHRLTNLPSDIRTTVYATRTRHTLNVFIYTYISTTGMLDKFKSSNQRERDTHESVLESSSLSPAMLTREALRLCAVCSDSLSSISLSVMYSARSRIIRLSAAARDASTPSILRSVHTRQQKSVRTGKTRKAKHANPNFPQTSPSPPTPTLSWSWSFGWFRARILI